MEPLLVRIDPAPPLVWERPDVLRIGFDRAEARLLNPSASVQRLLSQLRAGVPSNELPAACRRAGASRVERRMLLEQLAPVLRYEPLLDAQPDANGVEVAVMGSCGLADRLRDELSAAGFAAPREGGRPGFAVLIERFLQPAERAQPLLIDGVPHLPVRLTDRSLLIGPLVGEAGSPCLSCVQLREQDEDPVTAVLAAQLGAQHPAAETQLSGRFACALVLSALGGWLRGSSELAQRRLRFEVIEGAPSLSGRVERIDPHPECGCGEQSLLRAA